MQKTLTFKNTDTDYFFHVVKLQSSSNFNVQKIIDFYAISYIFSYTGKSSQYLKVNLQNIKEYYLNKFHSVIVDQLEKYHKMKRVDPKHQIDFEQTKERKDYERMLDDMRHTYRSKEHHVRNNIPFPSKPNESWNQLVEYLHNLQISNDIKSTLFYVDRINNAIHQTNTSIFDKFNNISDIQNTLEFCANATPQQLRTRASTEIKLMEEWE